ncbi:unnamed protein product [Thelazia callipaeda]|uniref:Elongator complex protein 4 n=1 Tax=Thelazia callipaeda TaxID=103827 RepID=A0A0N5DB96_THECL|nr:unnamed protein product [Thelazia callipaeda]
MCSARLAPLPRIRGTTSKSRYLEVSLGCEAVDRVIGGGMPLSSLFIVDEDKSRAFAPVLARYYCAEGVYCDHSLFVASSSRNPSELIENLPDRITAAEDMIPKDDISCEGNETMKIAWRYTSVPKLNSSLCDSRKTLHYDLTKKMDPIKFEAYKISLYPKSDQACCGFPSYSELYQRIRRNLTENQFLMSATSTQFNILRIVVEGVGSPLWQDPENDLKFLAHLRCLLCSYYSVAMIIVNTSGMSQERKSRLYAYGDLSIHLDAVGDIDDIKQFDDRFDGYFRLLKLPTVSSIATHCPVNSDLVFELQKRKFDIRVLHLPPSVENADDGKDHDIPCKQILDAF